MKHLMLGFAFVALGATTASAQEPLLVARGAVQVGDRLRATYLPDPSHSDREGTVIGEYAGLGPSTLRLSMLAGGQQVHEVDLNEILRLERPRRRTVGEGAGRGAIWGAAVGGLFGLGAGAACSGDFLCPGPLVGLAFFGGIGSGAGAAIGMAARGSTWEEVPLPEAR
jgi:hypothetical protein